MAKTVYKTTLLSVRDLTPTVRELNIQMPQGTNMAFQAGQFVVLHVPNGPKKAPRAYSMATSDKITESFSLIFKLVPSGVASEFVRTLKGGEELEFTGPFGKCLFLEPPTQQVLFVGTGAGISQHMSFLRSKAEQYPNVRYRLLLGVWNEDEIFYQPELAELQKQLKDFSYEYVLDKGSPTWTGKTGYVTDYLAAYDYLKVPTTFYLCGNPAMIKSVKELLTQQNFDLKRVVEEAFH